jgi:hypothetical protein
MNTVDFLQKILPEQGLYYIFLLRKNSRSGTHIPCHSAQELVNAIEFAKVNHSDRVIYHANSSFKQEFIAGGLTDRKTKYYRIPANLSMIRSFWLDIDTGIGRTHNSQGVRCGYETKNEAKNALVSFCREIGLPLPMLVDSGHGLHCYWVMDRDMLPSEWLEISSQLAAVLRHTSTYVDTSCTIDSVRVLRPVGTVNSKPGKPDMTVRLVKDAAPMSVEVFRETIETYVADNEVTVIKKEIYKPPINDDLSSGGVKIPSWAETIANKCSQVDVMRATQGDVSYEHWRAVGGLLKHCEDGTELAPQWTLNRYKNHTKTDIDHEMNSWNAGPPRCSTFETHNADGCNNCPFKGEIKSPIVLGYRELESKDVEQTTTKDGEEIVLTVPELPRGYSYINNLLCRSTEIEDRIEVVPFCNTLFYPKMRVQLDDLAWGLLICAHFPREGIKEFKVPIASISPSDLQKALGANQIVTTHHKKAGEAMSAYLKDWLDKLKHTTDEKQLAQSFGWDDTLDTFIIGNRLYCPDGRVDTAMLADKPKGKLIAFPKMRGSVEKWSTVIDDMYGGLGNEYRQYPIIASFGSALTPLSSEENYNGLLFAITGVATAQGKTTVVRTALTVWGDPDNLMSGPEGSTTNAMYASFGVYKNIPVLIDEATNMDNAALSALCYTVSSGAEKHRMVGGKSGVSFAHIARWKSSPYITANRDLHVHLSTRGSSTEAEAVRMIQIHMDEEKAIAGGSVDWQAYMVEVRKHQGTAGDKFMQYVVANQTEVREIMYKWMMRLMKDVPSVKFRFYRGHAECSMAALEICNKLGILAFDAEAVYAYIIKLFQRLAKDVMESNTETPEDAISKMITALSDSIAVTQYYHATRDGYQPEIVYVRGELAGRLVLGTKNNSEALAGTLYMSKRAVRMWCAQNRVSYMKLEEELDRLGIKVYLANERFMLGRGTNRPTGQEPCIALNVSALERMYGNGLPVMILPPIAIAEPQLKQAGA